MNGITILDQARTPMGPFSRAEVEEKLRRGEVSLSSLAYVEGLTQWTPLREVLAKVDGANPPVPAPVGVPAPTAGAMPTPAVSLSTTSPIYSYAATMQPPSHLVYAGFWLRFAAVFLDGLILTVFGFFFGAAIGFVFGMSGMIGRARITNDDGTLNVGFIVMELIVIGAMILVRWLYFALQESSAAQATLGKRALGIRVTDLEGRRISFLRATGRFFGKYISALTLCIGFMMAGFTERKQALHDMIASTLVVRN